MGQKVAKAPTNYPYPTDEQLKNLYQIIECEDDYGARHLPIRFGRAVLALWGESGYVQTYQPTTAQLSILALQQPPHDKQTDG